MAILGDTKATSLVVSGTSTLASINANSTGLGTNGQILTSTGTGIAWSSSVAPSSHSHGNITNAGAIGTAANKGVYTGTNGVLTAGTIPIAAGGTGLAVSPSMLTNLGSTTAANVLQASPRPGVTGTLGLGNGGTGATTAANAVNNLLSGAPAWTAAPTDSTYFIRQDTGGGNSFGRAPFSTVWTYIKGKADSVYAADDHNHDATYVNVSGDTMTGALTLSGAPTANLHAATKQYVDQSFAANDAMLFKGTIGSSGATVTALPNTHSIGWTYRVLTAGTYAGVKCEVGDLIICIADGTAANNAHWTVAQTNLDGAVIGPASATDGNFALFDGTTGKLIKNSSYSPSSFATSGHNHDSVYVNVSGDTMTGVLNLNGAGVLNLNGGDINLKTSGTSSDDSGDIAWWYGNGQEKMRIWSQNTYTAKAGPNFRVYKSDGTSLYSGTLALADHTHTTTLATDTGTSTITLASGGKYKLTTGGTSVIFTMPTSNNYSHPTGDGNLHVPATGTSNNGKFLKAGSTAGSISWVSLSSSDITTALGFTPYNATNPNGYTSNVGTITGVTGSDGLTGSGTSGSITIKHAAPSTSPAKTTSAVYPITIDKYGHITAAGTAVSIPAAVSVKGNAETSYRTGQVNLTPANLGIFATTTSVTVGSTTFSKYTHPTYTSKTSGLYKITVDGTGHISATTAVAKADITALGIPGSDTDTKVTAVDNHYTPATDTNAALSADASSTTAATWNTTSLVTGVNIQRDAKGHVTGVTVDSIKMPANPNSDTKNTAGSTNSDSKLFLIGATSQAANPQTYSDSEVYTTNGQLDANKVRIAENATLEYNSTTESLDFIFA